MMRIGKLFMTLVVFGFMLIGCSSNSIVEQLSPYDSGHGAVEQVETGSDQDHKSMTIWTSANSLANQIETFRQMYPDVEVNVVEVDQKEIVTEYMESMDQNDPPDLILMNDQNIGEFSAVDGFVNLLDLQGTDPNFFERLPGGLIENYKSFHEDKMFAMPILYFPYVTFYRADLLEQEGFPSDPDQLAVYMQLKENWLGMAKELKKSGYYMFDSPHSMLSLIHRSSNYFNEELDYIAARGSMGQMLEVVDQVIRDELSLQVNIWDERGQQALKEGKLLMLYLPSYGAYTIKEWLGEQSGNWRVTQMPLGMAGMDKEAGLSLAISSSSKNVSLAWEFVKISYRDMTNMYAYENKDPFFGGQDLNQVFRYIIDRDVPGQPTPLDDDASEVWELSLYQFMMGLPITERSLSAIEEDIINRIRVERRTILNLYP